LLKVFVLYLISLGAFGALDIDTKFTARILGASDTKKTILVNRGSEHGLALDQHAKISIPTGMIARAVTVRVSPSRSVWSVYRVFAKDKIEAQAVAMFKIASKVSLTEDESKALGALSEKVGKKTEPIPKDPEKVKEQKKIGYSILKSQRVTSQYDNVDYTKLQEHAPVRQELDRDLNWGGLNGKEDRNSFDPSLDYSNLR